MNILQKVSIRNLNLLAVRKIPPDSDIVLRHKKDLNGVSVDLIKEAGLSDLALEKYFVEAEVTEPTVSEEEPELTPAETVEKPSSRKPRAKGG